MLAIYQTGFHSLLLPDSSSTPQGQKGIELGQKVAKVNNFLGVLGVFSGKSETKKGKSEIYFGFGAFVVLLSSSFVVAVVVVSTGWHMCRIQDLQDLPEAGSGPIVVRSRLLPSLLLCFPALPFKYALISRFKGVLEGFGVRMYVYVGWVLCVDCGAFVCVRG